MNRRGTSVVEVLIALAIAAGLAALVSSLLSMGNRMLRTGNDNADGVQSVLLAYELLHRDAARMMFQQPADLAIAPDGRSLAMLIARESSSDLWSLDGEAVSYRLEPLPGPRPAFQLVRRDSAGSRPVRGCVLADLHFRFAPRGELSAQRSFIEVVLVGQSASTRESGYTLRLVLPVIPVRLPSRRSRKVHA